MKKVRVVVGPVNAGSEHEEPLAGQMPANLQKAGCALPAGASFGYSVLSQMYKADRDELDRALCKTGALHYMSSIGVGFWPPVDCLKCRSAFTPHSPVTKQARLLEAHSINPTRSAGEIRHELSYDGKQGKSALIPYGITSIDGGLLHVWQATAKLSEISRLLSARPALIEYRSMNPDGGIRHWSMTCPFCGVVSGEARLKPHPQHASQMRWGVAMAKAPVVLAVPTVSGHEDAGGRISAKMLFVPFP